MKQWITRFSLVVFASFIAMSSIAQKREAPQNNNINKSISMTDGSKSITEILFYDDFSDNNIDDWTVQGLGEGCWITSASNGAGGAAPELLLFYDPEFTGISRLVSPIINTTGYTELNLSYLSLLDLYEGDGVTLSIETTSDGGTTWNSVWELFWDDSENDYSANEIIILSNDDIGSENFQFCIKFEGIVYDINYWAIDNIQISDELASYDVAPTTILGLESSFYVEDEVSISATIKNYGQETVSFDTKLEILEEENVIFTSLVTIEDLESGEEQTVDFEVWTAAIGNYTAKVTTLLANDENTANDQLALDFVVLSNTEYCIPAGDAAMWIDDFEFAGIANMGSGPSENGYGDFSDIQGTAEIGSHYIANIEYGSGSMLMNTSIWIDFNQNYQFEDSELILTDSMPAGFGNPLVVDLQIPWEVEACITRMRIGAQFFESTSIDPCGTLSNGEWEDYTIELTGGALDIDAAVVSIDMYKAYEQASIIPTATIENWGVNTASFPVTCTIEGGYTSTVNITDLALGEAIQVEFDAWNVTPGEYLLEVETDLTGDNDPENDHMEKMISIAETAPIKMVVGEEGTGTWCGFCPKGAVYLDSMAMMYPETWIGIAVHNGDPMTNAEYDANIGSLIQYAYPRITVNRSVYTDPTYIESIYTEKMDYIAFADISIENKTFNETTHELSFTLTSNFVSTVSNFRFSAVLIENGVTGTGPGWSQTNYYAGGGQGPMGGYELLPDPVPAEDMVYEHVGRTIIGGFEGVEGSLPETVNYGETHSYEFSTIVDEEWDMNNIEVIGMLIDHESGFVDNATVDHLITGLEEIEISADINIYPNPARDKVYIQTEDNLDRVQLLNISGQLVFEQVVSGNKAEINTSDFEPGMYFVNVFSSNNIITRKLVIE